MNNFKVSYDAKKWEEIENSVHKVYSSHPDPRSAEAAYSISNAISDAFPVISRDEAMRNSQQIIENFTGYKLDTQGAWTEFVNTAKAQASDLAVSMKFSNAMLAAKTQGLDSNSYKQKIVQAMEELDSEELVYRNDFKDMSIFTDLLTETGRLVPSMLPTIGIYAAGGALSTVTGGASMIAAKGAGSVYSGMMEAGSVAKELFKIKDSNGNKLGDDYILSAWTLAMAGVGGLNLVTDGFEKVTAGIASNVAKKIFGKQSLKDLVKSGTVAKWGKDIAVNYLGKGIVGEAAEEAIEELIGMVASNYVIKNSNETEGTLFEGHSKDDIIKTMAQTALSTAKGMVLTGLPGSVVSTVQEYNASDTKLKRNANEYTGRSEASVVIPIDKIKASSDVSYDNKMKSSDSPVQVIRVGETYKPLDAANAAIIASLKKNGARALNVEMVDSSSEFNKYSIASARNFGSNYGKEVKDGVVLFDDQASMQKTASEYAMDNHSVYGYHEEDGQIILDRKQDDIKHSLIFRTKEYHESVKQNDPVIDAGIDPIQEPVTDEDVEPVKETQLELDEQAAAIEEQEQQFAKPEVVQKPEEVFKKSYTNLQKTLNRKGATDTEQRFINDKLIPQIHDVMRKQFSDLSEEQVYETVLPSAYFAFVTSKVAGMTTDEFFSKHFTPEAFVALTAKQEKDFLKSQTGLKSIEIQTGNAANEASLFGLTIPKKGKYTIGIGKSYSPLTVVHEIGHVMVKVIKDTEAFKPFLEIYKDQLSQDGGKIGVHFQETFAKDLEQYFIDGKVRDSSLKTMFKKIGDGIRELLHLLNPMLDNETRKAFDKLFDFKLEAAAKAETSTSKAPQLEFDLFGDPEKILASISKTITLENVKQMLANNEYPSDSDLQQHAGDPDVDWEIQFRRIMTQDIDVFHAFEKALDKATDKLGDDAELTPEKVLEVLEADNGDRYQTMLGEVRDPERFVKRLMWQSKYLNPASADYKFKRDISNFDKLKTIVSAIMKGRDAGSFNSYGMGPLSLFMDGVRDESKMSGYKIRNAKTELLSDVRKYRRFYYTALGYTQQLSYEDTVEGTVLDDGNDVEAFGNEEIKKLLESDDTDPVLKELIRKNLATGDVLQTLVDETSKQIEQLEMEVMDAEALAESSVDELTEKTEQLEQTEKQLKHTDKMYKKLQKTNTKNYEHMRVQKRMNQLKAKRLQYIRAKQQIDNHSRAINKIINSKSNNNDARIMEALKVSMQALMESTGQDLTSFFADRHIGIDQIPDQLKAYFTINNTGVFANKLYKDIDLSTVANLHNAALDVRREARAEKALRDMELKREVFKFAQGYAMSARGASWNDVKTENNYHNYMTKEKLDGKVQNAKNKYQAYFETKFITMSRIINKIDPEGKTLKPFIFGGYDKNNVFHRGIEGVLDDEKREEFKRFQAMRQTMEKYGITEKALLKKRVDVTGRSLTLEEAMGVYIYAQQSDALEKLTSPNGNKLIIKRDIQGNMITNEIKLVVDSLSKDEKAFADWMKDEMGSRWKEISDIYYEVNNKTLGYIANYFPLVRTGDRMAFDDLMQDGFLRMQDTPDDSNTRERTGGDYELQLNAFSIWNKMVAKQEHYIAGAEFFNKANKLMNKNGGDLYNLIAINNGKEYATALQDFLNRVANKRYIYDDADSMINKVRSNLVVARLGYNMLTVLKQTPALGLFAQQFGVGRLFEAIAHMTTDYKGTCNFIYEMSPQMRNHGISIDFSSLAQLEAKSKFGRTVKKVGEVGMTPIQFVDGFIKNTLWYGAYQNNIEKGMSDIDGQAAMEATRWINDTQPGGTTKDSAAIYDTNSTIVKFLLMFTNQLNKNLNIVYDIPYAIKHKMYEKAFRNTLGLGLSLAGIVALEGGLDDGDDDDEDRWNDILRNVSAQFVSMLPVVGPNLSDIMQNSYYSDSGMPLVSELNSLISAIESGKKKRIIDRSVNMGLGGAEFVGLPSGQTKKIWDAFTEDGKVNLWYLLGRDFVD
ncbi:hypothetical protein [Sphaerochaeta globosa]|uniref:Large polyvalent protein associated domain-containing protein n=1 Tax=Sphaerochaeta globosa (strain ATCC BAA-1886 / DSM 22777 / Buddy) TaxID=158189 RepID=F0RWR0_SPHGB|nr:hypothetical protein [Sphaerochaeta globosa]ADY13691.1 hypothetical protein SpiBuddy_1867 [Sphaerochaeta globosa str. Buddy]